MTRNQAVTVLVAAIMVISMVGVGFMGGTVAAQGEQVETTDTDDFTLLDYAANDGNSADVDRRGVLRAVQDLRADRIDGQQVINVLREFRSDDPVVETSIEDQNSTNGAEVTIASATYTEENFTVTVVNENTSEVLATSEELEAGTAEDLTFNFDAGSIEDTQEVSVTVGDADGDDLLVQGDPIRDSADVTEQIEGFFSFGDEPFEDPVEIGEDENASVDVDVNFVSDLPIDGELTGEFQNASDAVDISVNESQIDNASDGEGTINETIEFDQADFDLDQGDSDTFTLTVTTEQADVTQTVTGDIQVRLDEDFRVADFSPDEQIVIDGDDFNASTTIEQAGVADDVTRNVTLQAADNEDALFTDNATELANQSVTLDEGNSETIFESISDENLTNNVTALGVEVIEDDNTATAAVNVVDESTLDVSDLDVADAAFENDDIDVSATITNTGGEDLENETIDLRFNQSGGALDGDAVVASEDVSLDAGASTTVDLTVNSNETEVGDADIGIFSADDNQTATISIEAFEPADFVVTEFNASEEIVEGETATIDAVTVENQGNATGTQNVTYTLDGEEITVGENVTLEGQDINGENPGTFTLDDSEFDAPITVDSASDLAPGNYTQELSTENDSATVELTVLQGAEFDVRNAQLDPNNVEQGANVTATADVRNVGEVAATQDVEIRVDGEVLQTETDLSLEPGEDDSIELEFDTSEIEPGTVLVDFASEDDTETRSLTVNEPSEFNVTIANTSNDLFEQPEAGEDEVFVNGTVANEGGFEGNVTLELTIDDGDVLANETFTIGETNNSDFNLSTDPIEEAGDVTATVTAINDRDGSEDDSETRTITVLEPANYLVTDVTADSEVIQGDTLDVDFEIHNNGEVTGEQNIEVELANGDTFTDTNESFEVAPGEFKDGSATISVDDDASTGAYTLTVASDDDDSTQDVEVQPQTNIDIDSASFDDGNSSSDTVTIMGAFTSTADEIVSSITVGFGNIAGNVGLGNVDAGNVGIEIGGEDVGNVGVSESGDDLEVDLDDNVDLSGVDNDADIDITIDDIDTTEATADGDVSVELEDEDGNTIADDTTTSDGIGGSSQTTTAVMH